MANIEFDFEKALAKAYHDDETYQKISYIAKGLDMKSIKTEDAIRQLIQINSAVFSKVLMQYSHELLNEL